MPDLGNTDFGMKQQLDVVGIANTLQRKKQMEIEAQQQQRTQRLQEVQQTIQGVSGLVSASIANSAQRQKDEMIKNLGDSMAARYAGTVSMPQQGPAMPTISDQGAVAQRSSLFPNATGNTFSLDQGQPLPNVNVPNEANAKAIRASVELDPNVWNKQLSDQLLQSPLEQAQTAQKLAQGQADLSRSQKMSGAVTPATQALIQQTHAKIGTPAPDTTGMTEEQAQTYLGHAAKLLPTAGSPLADIRKQTLIATLNDRMDKKMTPANWGSSTVAGKSAQLVANADSGINLADQMLEGKIPTTEQTMTSLALDTNRVLTQTGTVAEKTTSELKAKTGFASFAQGMQYFTGHPEDQRLQPFVELLKKEMVRQRDQRQSVVDRTLSSELSSLNQLKRMSPQDWEDQIVGKGFDLEAAKKGHLKLRPEVGSSLYAWDQTGSDKLGGGSAPAGIQVDNNALDAEMKRRGL